MNKFTLTTLAAAFLVAASASAIAAPLSQAEYKAQKAEISNQYKTSKTACKSMSGNAKDICIEEAKGQEKIARAELEESYKPTDDHRYAVRVAKADATYEVAKEKCDDASGNAKDVCRKEAKSVYVAAKADAKVAEKTSEANTTAREKTTEVRKDAATDKRDASYDVAIEKCDAFAGDAKASCVTKAKTMTGNK